MPDPLAPFCILAGGLATRLGERAQREPKALVEVAHRPFIFHQLELLRSHGAHRVVLCVGHLGEQVQEAVGDGSAFGLDIAYSFDGPQPIGTAGAVRAALPLLDGEFYVLYGDTYLRIDYRAVGDAFRQSGKPALMTVLRNEGRWDTSNAVYEDGAVLAYDKRNPTPEMRWIDYGLGMLSAEAVTSAARGASDLADVYSELAAQAELAGYEATERFYEIGTPAALEETDGFLRHRQRRGPPSG
jgi:NDP-sugar pyrophosphorylase family protein